jgi:formate C-acetyltransferase
VYRVLHDEYVADEETMDVLARSSEQSPLSPSWVPSEGIQQLAAEHNRAVPAVGAERAIHYTDFYKNEAQRYSTAQQLNAHSLAYHLRHRTVRIYDNERIVGTHTEHRIGAICQIEKAGVPMLEDLFRFEKRAVNPLAIDPKARWTLLRSAIPYWLNRNITMQSFPWSRRIRFTKEQLSGTWFTVNEAGGVAHFLPDYESIIQLGTEGLRERVIARQTQGSLNDAQRDFLDASLVALDAIEMFADRYRAEAENQGRADLVVLLESCPRKPANSFHEALQTIWFFQLLVQMESLDQGISLGRMDQYLYSLYLKEMARGDFDPAEVRDLLAAFCLKLSEVIPLFSSRATKLFSGLPSGQALTIGGIDEDGNDASNELTFAFLDVMDGFKTRQPNWHARISQNSKPEYVRRVVSVISNGGGSPALYNDDAIMPAMVKRDVKPEKVWNYATVGCVEPALSKESFTSSDAALFNLAINLELVLGGGKQLKKSTQKKRPWLRGLESMDEVFGLFEKQTGEKLAYLKECLDAIEKVNAEAFPTPYSSLTIMGCIDSATDLSAGGAPYNASGIQAVGVADVVNSLAVVEQLVFIDKKYTLEELANACANNFEGQDFLRAQAQKVAKFGNDNEQVDHWANRVTAMFDRLVSGYTNTRGGKWMPGFYSMTCHQGFGEKTAALPSGRLSGKPLADGLAPVDGTDVRGPTASLNSVAKLEQQRFGNGINLNIKFDADTVAGEEGRAVLEALLRGYFSQGGMQVQLNVLDPKVLEEAMADPDSHRNLLVRISGYSAYFVDLTPEMQREIIDRSRQKAR